MKKIKCNIPKRTCNLRKDGYCIIEAQCQPIVSQCDGCTRIENGYCIMYINPKIKWRTGICPGATHIKLDTKEKGKRRLGQQKQKRKR